MKVVYREDQRHEIIVDDLPIASIVLTEGKVQWMELYDNFIHTKWELDCLSEFIKEVQNYEFVEEI